MTWTSFNRVKRLSQTWWGDWYRSFTYNGEYERVKTVQSDPEEPSAQTIYINPGTQQVPFYEVTTGSSASTRVYVSFAGKVVSQVRTTLANGVMQYHLMTDSQGSIISEGAYGNTTQDMSFDAWGKTRNPDDGSDYGLPPEGGWAWHNERLYTGHESHQDQYVINMNGRLYDPVLSRMMSADPFVPGKAPTVEELCKKFMGTTPRSAISLAPESAIKASSTTASSHCWAARRFTA